MDAKPTPTPWKVETIEGTRMIVSHKDYEIVRLSKYPSPTEDRNAAFIVRAVNFHQVLLNIARNLHYEHHPDLKTGCETCETIANAEAV